MSQRHRHRRLRFALAICLVALVALGGAAARVRAAAGDYPSPLYLAGIASAELPTSYKLIGTVPPVLPSTAPTATVTANTDPSYPNGTFGYYYTIVDSVGGETLPSPVSTNANTSGVAKEIVVGGLPTGVTVRLYRASVATNPPSLAYRLAELVNNSSTTYTDHTANA